GNGTAYTLTSISLDGLGSIPAGTIEFRIYCYAAAGAYPYIYNPGYFNYSSIDGTPVSYGYSGANVSLWFSSASALPVTLTDFKVRQQNHSIDLSWTTSSENNSWLFSIERSRDGISFSEIK